MKPNTKKGALARVLALALLASNPVFAAPTVSQATEYDYVVVGSGPGGGPLAANLAKAGYSVFLIEAGDTSPGQGFGVYTPTVTWDFFVNHYPENDPRNNQYSHLTWKTPEGRYWVGRTGAPAGSKLLGVYYPRGATLGGRSAPSKISVILFLSLAPDLGQFNDQCNVHLASKRQRLELCVSTYRRRLMEVSILL